MQDLVVVAVATLWAATAVVATLTLRRRQATAPRRS